MTPALIVQIGAGSIGIFSDAAALSVAKGERMHRAFGTAFVLSMLTVSVLALYLALKIMTAFLHGSPLLVPALAPLVLLAFWTIRVRLTNWFKNNALAAAY